MTPETPRSLRETALPAPIAPAPVSTGSRTTIAQPAQSCRECEHLRAEVARLSTALDAAARIVKRNHDRAAGREEEA